MLQTLGRRVLLCIGGDALSRVFLSDALREFELVFAPTGFEALRSINSQAFDGYVTDFWLPDWSGVQRCREVRKADPHCPIVVYTTGSGDSKVQRARRASVDAFVCVDEAHVPKPTLRVLLSRTDSKSLEAKSRMEEAALAEFARCSGQPPGGGAIAASFIERKTRNCAYTAFMKAGGSRAHFERWWPHVFASTRARYDSERA